ncbi:unnamed protein product [Effrenium voratum]|nr:unnamed protein product [Effrenium voratum]
MARDQAESSWFWDWDAKLAQKSQGHAEFQKKMKSFIDTELLPNIADWEEAGDFPAELPQLAYKAGVFACGLPEEHGGYGPAMDAWHKFIYDDELGRVCAGGLWASLLTHGISLPPILALGNEAQKKRYVKDIVTGQKRCSLAITEPNAGSDVAGMQTTARREKDVFVVNGQKTFISGGMHADYFTTGVRTGAAGLGGISLLMIHREMPGVQTTRLKTQGWGCSSTTSVAFNDVRVPVENLLGQENQGFLPIMLNFNNERMSMAVTACRMSRCCLEDAIRYARVRKTFGKPLVSHQVIRHKLAEMARHVLANHGFLCNVAQAMEQDQASIGGQVALAKVQSTRTLEFCAREASQVLGGRSYLRGAHGGGRIERCYREVRVYAIGGGSEEIMLELAGRMAKL